MSMRIVNAFMKEPCTGFGVYEWDAIGVKAYKTIGELLEDFATHGEYSSQQFRILKVHCKRETGNCKVYELELKTEYQYQHLDCNQAEYHAELVIMEDK